MHVWNARVSHGASPKMSQPPPHRGRESAPKLLGMRGMRSERRAELEKAGAAESGGARRATPS